ncbi:MAG: CRTAC1 family protein, partial [Planctomycetaceae bacterium]
TTTAGCGKGEPFVRSVETVVPGVINPATNERDEADVIPPSAFDDEVGDKDWFETTSAVSSFDFVYRNGEEGGNFFILESLGGGAAVFDYDKDGDVEIFFTGGGTLADGMIAGLSGALFRNVGPFQFTNVSKEAELDTAGDYSHGCFVSDYDCDGFPDLLVTAFGRCRLFHNNGDGCFQDIIAVALQNNEAWWTGAAWGDIDRDGFPDLFVTGYLKWSPESDRPCWNGDGDREVCGPRLFQPADDCVYRNCGNGMFKDVSDQVGLKAGGNGLAVIAAELNGDNLIDFYVANDESDNFLYPGQTDGTLKEIAHTAGVAVNQYGMHDGSMGVDAGDYDGDGLADLWVTNFELEDNSLYRNLGDQLFQQTTNAAGLAGRSRLHVGFGTAMEDFNSDGWLDLFVANGHVFYNGGQLPYLQPSQLFMNQRNGRFTDVSLSGGPYFRTSHSARGAAVGDFDDDGAPDLVVVHQNQPAALLRNRIVPARFCRIQLIGTHDHRDAVGAVVSIASQAGRIVRLTRSGAGYLSSSDQRILLPADEDSIDVEVRWPDGSCESFPSVRAGETSSLIQGRGVADASP